MPPKSKLALQQKKPRLKRTAHLSAGGKDVVVLKEVKIKEQQEENVCKLTSEGVSSTAEVISWKTSDVTAETCVVAEHVHVGGDTTQDACEKRLPDEIKDTRDVVYDCDQCGPNTLSCVSVYGCILVFIPSAHYSCTECCMELCYIIICVYYTRKSDCQSYVCTMTVPFSHFLYVQYMQCFPQYTWSRAPRPVCFSESNIILHDDFVYCRAKAAI